MGGKGSVCSIVVVVVVVVVDGSAAIHGEGDE